MLAIRRAHDDAAGIARAPRISDGLPGASVISEGAAVVSEC